ncbi:squamosa promoter-binding-like protein 1 [Lycium ferocissimum]|uniref:squamosa promoter-binding-like protein 1 n=1 Tax=Lycium ferocissimum TaxID=112874 RepID=UPI0028166F9A|nr:squamosa promoter-binding-like protein 1 [Lycium ferocissimum]XP_059317830.1 squamosa promoter-binding-like protein 1 [Lycium ferocissimum]
MEARKFHVPVVSNLEVGGKKSREWDSNGWKWDGDRFIAEQVNSLPSDCCRSKQLFPTEIPETSRISNGFSSGNSDELTLGNDKGRKDLEKRRRTIVIEDENEKNDGEAVASLNLKLGEQLYPVVEGKRGKKTKIGGVSSSNYRAFCQVQDCQADLSSAKDYHRRHKVCDVHSKAVNALVGNVMQRFCQQCSRFHVLEEFDEGKRSCRRRLAGHNRRRRKTHPENVANGASSMNDEGGSNYLLISLLRILANVQFNSSDQTKDQDLLSHLLRNLASLAGANNERNAWGLLPVPSNDQQNTGTSMEAPKEDSLRPNGNCSTIPASEVTEKRTSTSNAERGISQNPCASQPDSTPINANGSATTPAPLKLNIDLNNNIYDDSQGGNQMLQNSGAFANPGGTASSGCPLWISHDPHKESSTRTSWNSGSTSSLSPSSSSGEAQSRTDRIVFKLFGKDPGEFPTALRKQILDWLSHSPTDIESYIRPGCIILTIYLRMDKSIWEELYCDLNSSLRKLLNASADSFWRTGWIYTRVNDRVAFLFNGQVVLDTPLPVRSHRISIVKPIAVCASERVQFLVKGFNLSRPTTRLLCALEGKYLVQGNCTDMMVGADSCMDHEEIQSLSFPCIVPNVTGRGFIEVEDHGLSSNFFPFIVAEKDVCSEIRTLESIIEVAEELQARDQALDFLHELGWLLHRSHLKFRLGSGANLNLYPFQRFKWLIDFSVDHDWCAVVKKLLDVFFDGIVDVGQQQSSLDVPLREVGLLHRAVRRKCRSMIDVLLKYHHRGAFDKSGLQKQQDDRGYLFRPDAVGPGGLTPLHVVASLAGFENLLDALIDDPGQVGIEAWKSARDSTGLTPNDYACLRGHYSYVHMVQKKINQKPGDGHVVLDISGSLLDSNLKQKLSDGPRSIKVASLQMEKFLGKPKCRQCKQKLSYGNSGTSLAIYKPAVLSMVAIATVCVCVALLFKSSPEVLYSFRPFRWELLKYGSI